MAADVERLGFVRNNPFIRQDLASSKQCRNSHFAGGSKLHPPSAAATVIKVRTGADSSPRISSCSVPRSTIDTELQYGPGIVQKLRHKFDHLAEKASKEVEISQYSRKKKFPSVGDLLSENISVTNFESGTVFEESQLISGQHSKSIGDLDELNDDEVLEENLMGYKEKNINDQKNDNNQARSSCSISILRAKFEHSSNTVVGECTTIGSGKLKRKNSRLVRLIADRKAMRLRSPKSQNEADRNIPEFLSIAQCLRHVPDREISSNIVKELPINLHREKDKIEKSDHILEIDSTTSGSVVQLQDFISPPDPEVRHRITLETGENDKRDFDSSYFGLNRQHSVSIPSTASFTQDQQNKNNSGEEVDRSPPPEEPLPPLPPVSYLRENCTEMLMFSQITSSSVASAAAIPSAEDTIIRDNGNSGQTEMDCLEKNESTSNGDKLIAADDEVFEANLPAKNVINEKEKLETYNVKESDGGEKNGEEDEQQEESFISTFEIIQVNKQELIQVNQEKDVTRDEESEPVEEAMNVGEVQIGNVTARPPIEVAHHFGDIYPPEITRIDHDLQPSQEELLLAGDGNPVRHSLLSLVAEEDRGQLLEAMAETFHFRFDHFISPNKDCSLLRTPKQPPRQTALSVSFSGNGPDVYAYPNDLISEECGRWLTGQNISFSEYQQLVADEQDSYASKQLALIEWETSLKAQKSAHPSPQPPSPLQNGSLASQLIDESMGVTGKIIYKDSKTKMDQNGKSAALNSASMENNHCNGLEIPR